MSHQPYKDLGEVIKSPLDSNAYKAIKLCSNNLRALLISTCDHPLNVQKEGLDKETCAFLSIQDFNQKYLNIVKDDSPNVPKEKSTSGSDEQSPSKSKPKVEKKSGKNPKKVNCSKSVSEEGGERVTVVLVIGSGMTSDPMDVPGLAHITEHCIAFGSKKYPEKEHFGKFCQKYGGDTTAGTNAEVTCFAFTLEDVEHLEEALDIFADTTFNPLFKDVVSEVESLNSEFYTNKLNDDYRYLALLLWFLNQNHTLGRYGFGSRHSLLSDNKDLAKTMRDWTGQNYLPSNMVISIEAPLPVEKLGDLIVRKFGSCTGCSCNPPPRQQLLDKFQNVPIIERPCHWNIMTYFTPLAHAKWVKLAWTLPPEPPKSYRTKPLKFVTYLLTSLGKGSLDFYLRSKGWITQIETCCCPESPDWGFASTIFCCVFFITLKLTSEGLVQREEVIKAVFSYLKMLQKSSPRDLQRVFDEMKQTNADTFHYRSDDNILDLDPVNSLSYYPSLRDDFGEHIPILQAFAQGLIDGVDPTELLTAPLLTREFNAKLIYDYIQRLTPTTANFMVAATEFEARCTDVEALFKTKFFSERVNSKFITGLKNVAVYSEFHLPPPNDFIHKSLCYPANPTERLEHKGDIKIVDSSIMSIYYSNEVCKKGHLPTAFYYMALQSPCLLDPAAYGLLPTMEIWTNCLSYVVRMKIGPALTALIKYDISYDDTLNMLLCSVWGPSHRLPDIFEVIVNTIVNFESKISPWMFENIRETHVERYEDVIFNSESLAEDLKMSVLVQKGFMAADHLQFLTDLLLDELIEFTTTFKENLFIDINLEGCVSKSQGDRIAVVANRLTLTSHPWTFNRHMLKLNRAVMLPLGERCLRIRANNKSENNNLVVNHYQVEDMSESAKAVLQGLETQMHNAAYNQLRTAEQIGYYIDVCTETYHSGMGITLKISASADKFTSQFIDERVDNFMIQFFEEVIANKPVFNDLVLPYMEEGISWADVNDFYTRYLHPEGDKFRKLSVQIGGNPEDCKSKPRQGKHLESLVKKHKSTTPFRGNENDPLNNFNLDIPKSTVGENGYFITNLVKFKNSRGCYPNLISFEEFER